MNILLTYSDDSELTTITESIKNSAIQLGHNVVKWSDPGVELGEYLESSLEIMLEKTDLVIAHISTYEGDIALEVGYALGSKKPVLIACEKNHLDKIHPEIFGCITIVYEKGRIQETLLNPLSENLGKGNIEKYLLKEKAEIKRKKEIKTVFVSYSHIDSFFLERLNIHIKPFEKNGLIDFWSDKKIKAGEKWKDKILFALDKAALAILLISADFLASDFIVDNELPPLLKAAEEKGTVILPVILKPCRFTKTPSLAIFQSINDPSLPLTKMDENQREELYVKICDYIENLIHQ